jgi:hypoxanthine-guanine phosphoribosyltransferase
MTFVSVNIKHFIEKLNHYNLSLSVYLEIEHILKDMHKNLHEKDKVILEDIINDGIKTGEFRKCNSSKITQSVLQVLEAVKCKDFCVKSTVKKSESITKINKNFEYLLTVLLDGLIMEKARKN